MHHPVIVHIRPGKSLALGIMLAPLALVMIGFGALRLVLEVDSHWLMTLSLIAGLAFGAMAVFFMGIALKKPIALRMDHKGISGFYVSPATWDEIAEVGAFSETTNPTGRYSATNTFLGFRLHDPIAFRDRQTAWGRFKSWSSGRSSGFHLVVPEKLIRDYTADELAVLAQALKSGA